MHGQCMNKKESLNVKEGRTQGLNKDARIQGKILNKDLEALSDQLDKVTQQMSDRLTARSLETIVINMQDLTSRRVQPLMKQQDTLLYKLAALDLQIQPLQRQINESLARLKTIQYYIDNQGDKIAQLVTVLFALYAGRRMRQKRILSFGPDIPAWLLRIPICGCCPWT
ncbi:hypothetical protein WN48_04166 [Eufriesea mexicana]|nr:hypothetical protein WN48_04166 [Eufriesea mexicana]